MTAGTVPYALQWQRPRVGWWKCNVDSSFYGGSGHTDGAGEAMAILDAFT
ncbi:hypothetical protein L195_g031166 [Trifolium pratense]|uniref:RNase H type-1 domain-containing protein n=1 Tax=Trifolium pratense TaxID=57577 RepID=A0A2K3L9N2_TRIPR|nr:hypothetical protein L195_g031166 [Trifolium pratense]